MRAALTAASWETLELRLEAPATPVIRKSNGKMELLVPVRFQDSHSQIVQEFVW